MTWTQSPLPGALNLVSRAELVSLESERINTPGYIHPQEPVDFLLKSRKVSASSVKKWIWRAFHLTLNLLADFIKHCLEEIQDSVCVAPKVKGSTIHLLGLAKSHFLYLEAVGLHRILFRHRLGKSLLFLIKSPRQQRSDGTEQCWKAQL